MNMSLTSDPASVRRAGERSQPAASAAPACRDPAASDALPRLDWRFLLPSAATTEVVYRGPAEHPLAAALRSCGPALGLNLRPDDGGAVTAAQSVVLCAEHDEDAVRQAAAIVHPGGYLFVEMRAGHQRRVRRLLIQLGFDAVRLHWHVPDFGACAQIIPLDDPRPVAYQLRQQPGWARLLGIRFVTQWLLATRLLPGRRACISILARRCERGAADL